MQGKTVQTIALLSHIVEKKNNWGPFLVIAPSATLHNWCSEFKQFLPAVSVMPYWGAAKDRKTLRKTWNQSRLSREDAPFHVLISSYRLFCSYFL